MAKKAMDEAGVVRIDRDDIPSTIAAVSWISGIPITSLHLLGSAGKQSTSGDIDLAINLHEYDMNQIHARMLSMLGGRVGGKLNTGLKIGSYAVPIAGTPQLGLVQVDLMYVSSTKWAEFSYYSLGDKSKYKGAVRAVLLSSVASTINIPGQDWFAYDGNELIVRVGWGIDPNVGLKRITQMRGRNKRTGEWLKSMKKVTPVEIETAFPDLEFDDTAVVINDPTSVVQILFGSGATLKDVTSAEGIINVIHKVFSEERTKQIFSVAAKRLDCLKDKMDIPKEVEEYCDADVCGFFN